ncbi:MAG: DUF1566 domain-containing protein [Spirochaetes bacterium]|nr:DUF1566 domain-containing protein [Spirochaetota bacterium]
MKTYRRLLGMMALAASLAFATCNANKSSKLLLLPVGGAGDTGGRGEIAVTISAIPGVVVPVRGAVPVNTVIDTAQYKGIIIWSPADNPFAAATVYTANISLISKSGFTMTGVAANLFTVAGATTVTNPENSGNVTAVFPVTGAASDLNVEFSGATETGGTSETTDSTGLKLFFNNDPATLTVDNITVTGATKGALSGSGNTRTIAISNITVGNGERVTVTITSPAGYAITGSPQTAVVYRLLAIGVPYQGGVIAYIYQFGDPGFIPGQTHGLIAATADQGIADVWALSAYQSTAVPGGTGTALGTGLVNTFNIIAQNGAGSSYAAGLAWAYTGGGYIDWHLPSKDELNKLYLNRTVIGGFLSNYYLSSSEYDASWTYRQFFGNGNGTGMQSISFKSTHGWVRAVRSF